MLTSSSKARFGPTWRRGMFRADLPGTASASAAVVVSLVLGGELGGALFQGTCDQPGAEVLLPELPSLVVGPEARRPAWGSDRGDFARSGRIPMVTPWSRPIVVSTGDLLGPEPLSGFALEGPTDVQEDVLQLLFDRRGRPVFDAALPGEFELSAAPGVMERLERQGGVPWTVANIDLTAEHRQHRVFVRKGIRLGLTGAVDEGRLPSIHPQTGPSLRPAVEGLNRALAVLKTVGVDTRVMMLHVGRRNGLLRVIELLRSLDGPPPEVVLTSPLHGNPSVIRLDDLGTVVVPAPDGATDATIVRMEFGRHRELLRVRTERRPVPTVPSGRADRVRNWACKQLDVPLDAEGWKAKISAEDFLRFSLTSMRRLARAEIAFIPRSTLGPDASFPLPRSPTRLDVRRALPFDEGLVVTEVRGSALGRMEKLVGDSRVAVQGLGRGTVSGRRRDPRRVYRVVTVDFVAAGGEEILPPGAYEFDPVQRASSLRSVIANALSRRGFDPDADPDADVDIAEPVLFDFRVEVGGNLKSVNVENRAGVEAPQLTRQNFLSLSGNLQLRLSLDFPKHRFELLESTRIGVIRETVDGESEPETRENEDVTVVELVYSGRLAGGIDRPWVPDAGASARFETELTIPEERNYRRALLQLGVGPSWQLADNLYLRSQLGLRRELDASAQAEDPDEAGLAQTKVALLSVAELRDEAFGQTGPRPVRLNVRIDHTADLSGQLRDQVLQGSISLDVPVTEGLALTAGVDVYVLHRERDGEPAISGGALDTSLGIKSTADFSEVLD